MRAKVFAVPQLAAPSLLNAVSDRIIIQLKWEALFVVLRAARQCFMQ